MALKIGLVSGEYPPMEGGVGAYTQALAQALHAYGHEIHVITSRRAQPPSVSRSLLNRRDPFDLGYGYLHPWVQRWWWSAVGVVAEVALRFGLDVINLQYQAAAFDMRVPAINFLPWRLRNVTSTVVTFHDLRTPYLFPKAGRLRQRAVQYLAESADGIIVTNGADYEVLSERGLRKERLRQIPIGSNIVARSAKAEDTAAVRKELGLPHGACLLGFFGFLNESKGADTLLKAMAGLAKRTHLLFIGGQTGSSDRDNNAAFVASIKQLTEELGLQGQIHWSGFLPESGVSSHLHAVDLMVMPYRDGASLRRGTLMATLAHGRPLISTSPARPIPALVHGQNVWFVPVDDPIALGEAIRVLAADSELQARLGQGAARAAAEFTWDRIAGQTAEFYETLVNKD